MNGKTNKLQNNGRYGTMEELLIQLTKLTIIKAEKTRSLSEAHVFVRLSASSISNVEHYA